MKTGSVSPSADNYYNHEVALNELLRGGVGLGTATLSQVADTDTSTTLLVANDDRRGFVIHNSSSAILYVAYAATASTTAFTYKLVPTATLECFGPTNYTGLITGIWASDPGTGSAIITELEA